MIKSKKGFTLIELLAVIVILGIITAVAVPEVLNIIKDTNKKAFTQTADGLVDSIYNAVNVAELSGNSVYGTYTIVDNEIVEANSFKYNGKLPDAGIFTINQDGKIQIIVHNDDWCVKKDFEEINYTIKKFTGGCTSPTPESCFTFNSLTGTITDYSDTCTKDVVIPDKIGGVPVLALGTDSFLFQDLINVEIPNTVTLIDVSAFWGNLLTNVDIPDSVITIEYGAFAYNAIETLTLSDNLITLGDDSFYENKISSVILPDGLTYFAGLNGNDLTSITIPNTVTTIGDYALCDNLLTSVFIPGNVTSIGQAALQYNSLNSVTIEDGVVTIGDEAFEDNLLTSITIPNSVTSIGITAFKDNNLSSMTLPSSITSIGNGAFANNSMPDGAAFIYNRNGDGSINTTSLNSYAGSNLTPTIPSGVTIVGAESFENKMITSVTIPSSVTTIGASAFCYCNLTNVVFAPGTSLLTNSIGRNAFYKSNGFSKSNVYLTSIIYPGSTLQNWKNAINGVSGTQFTTGTVTNTAGNVVISAS